MSEHIPHGAAPGEEPDNPVNQSVLVTQPVVLLVLVAVITQLGGAVALVAVDQTLTGILVAAGAFLTGVGGVLARSLVTPTARPQDGSGNPLTPLDSNTD